MSKLDLEKAEEPEIKLPTSVGSLKKWESSRKTSIYALLTSKTFVVDHNKPWKFLKELGILDHLPATEKCVKKQQLELDLELQICST